MRALSVLFVVLLLAAGCTPETIATRTSGDATPCGDPWQVAEAFYSANDAGNDEASVALLSDDVLLATWAQGVQGYHVSSSFAVGKDQVRKRLGEPGLKRRAVSPERPNFREEKRRETGNVLHFELTPDRKRANGRPFNPYSVELVLSGCRIEIIKVIERVTWL